MTRMKKKFVEGTAITEGKYKKLQGIVFSAVENTSQNYDQILEEIKKQEPRLGRDTCKKLLQHFLRSYDDESINPFYKK